VLTAVLILALALLIFGIVGVIKIAAWLALFIVLAALVVGVAAAVARRSRRSGTLSRTM
jgi:NhaP-type Na+/H+ and K+/H+ antiporter